jgi:hypothetical protein
MARPPTGVKGNFQVAIPPFSSKEMKDYSRDARTQAQGWGHLKSTPSAKIYNSRREKSTEVKRRGAVVSPQGGLFAEVGFSSIGHR